MKGKRTYTVRTQRTQVSKNGHAHVLHSITIPVEYGRMLAGQEFAFSIDDEGFHFTPVLSTDTPALPAWARPETQGAVVASWQ